MENRHTDNKPNEKKVKPSQNTHTKKKLNFAKLNKRSTKIKLFDINHLTLQQIKNQVARPNKILKKR